MRARAWPAPRSAQRRLGQHFLEPGWAEKVVNAIDPRPDQVFLEIGPGRGALTIPLAEAVARVLAVEIDRDLAAALERRNIGNVRVIAEDFLTADLDGILRADGDPLVRIAGNLPYYVVTPILFKILHFADGGRRVRDAVLMLQKEVGDRLLARPGTKEYGVLTIHVALRAEVTRLLKLPPGAFRPTPRVASTLLHLKFRPHPVHIQDVELFEELVASLFGRRRKTLRNALRPFATQRGRQVEAVLERAMLSGSRRPETLILGELASILEVFVSA